MNLWEITNGWTGESYCRAYAWASTEEEALRLFREKNPTAADKNLKAECLMEGDANPFCTLLSDCGWETK